MATRKFLQAIPLILIIFFQVIAVFNIISNSYYFLQRHQIAIVFTCLCLISYFIHLKTYKIILTITLVLGIFNVLSFTASISYLSFNFNGLEITFQPLSFFLLILFTLLNLGFLKKVFLRSSEQREMEKQSAKSFWENRYEKLPLDELHRLHADKEGLNPEAREALERILENRE